MSVPFALVNGCATTEDVEPQIGEPVPQGGGTGLGGATGSGGSSGGAPSSGSGGATKSGTGAKTGAGGAIFGGSSGGKTGTGLGSGGKSAGGSTGKGTGGTKSTGTGGTVGKSTGGAVGTGGGSGTCDWTSCSAKSCDTACPTNAGTYCAMACNAYITCFQGHPDCSKSGDPLCIVRTNGVANVCTMTWESAGGPQTGIGTTGSPSAIAANYVACACDLSIPGVMSAGTGIGTGTGGGSGFGAGGKSSTGGKAGF